MRALEGDRDCIGRVITGQIGPPSPVRHGGEHEDPLPGALDHGGLGSLNRRAGGADDGDFGPNRARVYWLWSESRFTL
jgi:hypothetical protein